MLFHKERRVWPYVLIASLAFLGLGVWFLLAHVGALAQRLLLNTGITERIINSNVVQQQLTQEGGDVGRLVPELLGFRTPRTYLVLFLNNTELRPGGGFIGSYAVVKISKGVMDMAVVEGSELLDWRTPDTWKPIPPKRLQQHLGVDRWYFRDSNWSPDFAVSADKALELYAGEGGAAAEEIDTVIAITPDVLEEVLRQVGPITVNGITFTPDTVTETLEYEVEYDFVKKGLVKGERKIIIETFFRELSEHVARDVLFRVPVYVNLFKSLASEKHILLYSKDASLMSLAETNGWAGKVESSPGDYLMWVDSNLGALKTDHAMERHMKYAIVPVGREYRGTAAMTYIHTGTFDWRTSRYLTYARVYVPRGSTLVSASVTGDRPLTVPLKDIDQGEELGKQWFGYFLSVEPGKTRTLQIAYTLSQPVGESVSAGRYQLAVQKQAGTEAHGLTLSLKFGNTITSAIPAEEPQRWGDDQYDLTTDLRLDRVFTVSMIK